MSQSRTPPTDSEMFSEKRKAETKSADEAQETPRASERRAEEELRDSLARLAGIVDSAMDAIITVNSEQGILVFNRAAEKMFRRALEKNAEPC